MTLYSSFGSRHVAAFVWSTWDHDPRKIPTVDTTIYHHLADYQIVVTTGRQSRLSTRAVSRLSAWTLPCVLFPPGNPTMLLLLSADCAESMGFEVRGVVDGRSEFGACLTFRKPVDKSLGSLHP